MLVRKSKLQVKAAERQETFLSREQQLAPCLHVYLS